MGGGGEGGDFFGGLAAGLGVGGEDVVDGGELDLGSAGENTLDDFGNAHERKAVFEEGGDGDFVGSIESGWMGATFFHGFTGETEAREAASGSLLEVEALELGPVKLDLLGRDGMVRGKTGGQPKMDA